MKTCSVQPCHRTVVRRGMCRPHYDEQRHPLAKADICDICQRSDAPVTAYSLHRRITSHGGIRLCDRCWERYCSRRVTPEKAPHSTFRGLAWAEPR